MENRIESAHGNTDRGKTREEMSNLFALMRIRLSGDREKTATPRARRRAAG